MTAPKLLESGLDKTDESAGADGADMVKQAHGGALRRRGALGNKGNTTRNPDWLKAWCDNVLARKATREQVRKVLEANSHPAFATMWKAAADRAHGKPKESKEISGTLDIRVVRDA